jgi:hypothetical protein
VDNGDIRITLGGLARWGIMIGGSVLRESMTLEQSTGGTHDSTPLLNWCATHLNTQSIIHCGGAAVSSLVVFAPMASSPGPEPRVSTPSSMCEGELRLASRCTTGGNRPFACCRPYRFEGSRSDPRPIAMNGGSSWLRHPHYESISDEPWR